MSKLALLGGPKVRDRAFPTWPIWDAEDARAVADVVRSGAWGIPRGGRVSQFEESFAAFQKARYGVCTQSGTSALEVALRACGIGLGDEVITSPYTFVATASSLFHVGAVPIFVDVDPGTYNIDPSLIEAAVTTHTKAVIPVHVAGCPADMDGILEASRKLGLIVIEDACQAHGAQWNGKGVGAIGDCGTFSFQSTKNLNCGEGGIILTDREDLYERAYAFHYVGSRKDGTRPDPPVLGTNKRMTEIQGALLLSQMRRLPEQIQKREENAAFLTERLSDFGLNVQERSPRATCHAWHLFIMRYNSDAFHGIPRDRFVEALSAEGIPCSTGYRPLYVDVIWRSDAHVRAVLKNHPRKVDFSSIALPVCERICKDEAIWLTQNLLLGDRSDVDSIVSAVAKIKEHASDLD